MRRIRRTVIIVAVLTILVLFATGAVGSSIARAKDLVDTAAIALAPAPGWPQQTGITDPDTVQQLSGAFVEMSGDSCAVYSMNGTRLNSIQSGYARPALAAGKTRFVLYNRSGNELRVESRTQNLYTKTMDSTIYLCAVADAGQVAVVTDNADSAAALTVYNASMQQQLGWNLTSEQGIPLRMAFSPDSRRLAAEYHNASFGSMRTLALTPCSPFSVSGELMKQSALLARELGLRLHTHLAETKDEENYTLAHFGMKPYDYIESLGWTGSDVWYAHGIHFTDDELIRIAKSGSGVAHCPISNMKLASGVAKVPRMLELGIPVGLAVDGSASNDGSSLMEELRVAFLLHRLNSSKAAPTGYDILKMATRGSARLLGRDDIGQIAVGKCADLFMIDSRRLELVGSCYDPKSVLGTVGVRGPVDYTVVNGKVTVEHGRLATIDEEKIALQANQKCDAYLSM